MNWSILAATRFFLAFVVLNVHLVEFDPTPWTEFFSRFGGKAAVVGFLVISGYSVTSSFDRNPQKFLLRRLVRIYPAYLFAILCAVVLQTVMHEYSTGFLTFRKSEFWEILGNLALVQMYLCKAISFNPVVWSLSLEFSYYVYLRFFGHLKWLLIATLIVSVAYGLMTRDIFPFSLSGALRKLNMVAYIWPFIAGIFLSRYMSWPLLAATGIGGAAVIYPLEPLAAPTFLITVAAIAAATFGRTRSVPALNYLGDISYPLYLMHVPVTLAIVALSGRADAWVAALASLGVSALVLRLVEHPFGRLMKQLGSVRTDKVDEALPPVSTVRSEIAG